MNARPDWTLVNNGNPGPGPRTMFRDDQPVERGQSEPEPMPQQRAIRRLDTMIHRIAAGMPKAPVAV